MSIKRIGVSKSCLKSNKDCSLAGSTQKHGANTDKTEIYCNEGLESSEADVLKVSGLNQSMHGFSLFLRHYHSR